MWERGSRIPYTYGHLIAKGYRSNGHGAEIDTNLTSFRVKVDGSRYEPVKFFIRAYDDFRDSNGFNPKGYSMTFRNCGRNGDSPVGLLLIIPWLRKARKWGNHPDHILKFTWNSVASRPKITIFSTPPGQRQLGDDLGFPPLVAAFPIAHQAMILIQTAGIR